jgi:hypothetical protein
MLSLTAPAWTIVLPACYCSSCITVSFIKKKNGFEIPHFHSLKKGGNEPQNPLLYSNSTLDSILCQSSFWCLCVREENLEI